MAPKTKEQFAKIRSESEEKILEAALELFGTNGYQATTISQIAKQAGVSKGLIYNYFESKKALLRQIMKNTIEIGMEIVDQALNDYESPEEELEHMVMDSIGHIRANFKFWRLLTMISFQKEAMDSLEDIMKDHRKLSIEKGVELFTKLGSPSPLESAMLFGAALDGLFLYYIHVQEEFPLEQMGRNLIKTFIDKNSIHRSNH